MGVSGGPEIEFENSGIEIQGVERLAFGDQSGSVDGLDMSNKRLGNVGSMDMNGTIDVQSNGDINSINRLNVSSIDSNNGDGHINVTQSMHFDGTGGNTETYELRVDGKGLEVHSTADFSNGSVIVPVV